MPTINDTPSNEFVTDTMGLVLHLNRPVITNDPAIQASDAVLTLWE